MNILFTYLLVHRIKLSVSHMLGKKSATKPPLSKGQILQSQDVFSDVLKAEVVAPHSRQLSVAKTWIHRSTSNAHKTSKLPLDLSLCPTSALSFAPLTLYRMDSPYLFYFPKVWPWFTPSSYHSISNTFTSISRETSVTPLPL